MIYEAVYKSEFVVKALGKVPHVSKKLAKVTSAEEANKVLNELWEKIAKAEKASDLTDKKLSKTIAKIQDLHEANVAEFPEKLMNEFRDVSLESYAISAAATLAIEELELVKENLERLQHETIH
jgi:type I site-specific restriction endonuclease